MISRQPNPLHVSIFSMIILEGNLVYICIYSWPSYFFPLHTTSTTRTISTDFPTRADPLKFWLHDEYTLFVTNLSSPDATKHMCDQKICFTFILHIHTKITTNSCSNCNLIFFDITHTCNKVLTSTAWPIIRTSNITDKGLADCAFIITHSGKVRLEDAIKHSLLTKQCSHSRSRSILIL